MSGDRETLAPLVALCFDVEFKEHGLARGAEPGAAVALCSGSFAECTGLEATMEPKVINEGGRNAGSAQRVGRVSYGTVVLKRGVTSNRHLWHWWKLVSGGSSAYRLTATITLRGPAVESGGAGGGPVQWRWQLRHCLPVKFKAPDLNARGSDVAIEELHLAHEGLLLVDGDMA
jgi:phage tail-like protein